VRDDRPIESKSEDRLGRADFAEHVARFVVSSPPEEGYVVALNGAWGSGKTSTLNMILESIGDAKPWVIVRFNPWMVTRPEELIGRFFQQVVAAISTRDELRRAKAGERLAQYAEAVGAAKDVPVLGRAAHAAGLLGGIGAWWANRRSPLRGQSADEKRRGVESALRAHDVRLLVVIDDLDRLGADEIRDIIRLIRLIADFPRTVYLLAFDPQHVIAALAQDGQTYLEKIVQVPLDLPPVRREDLDQLLFAALDASIAGVETGPFEQGRWTDTYHRVVQPLIRNLRDISRYANGLRPAVAILAEEVSLVDLFALEAVRVRLPSVFALLYRERELLTFTRTGFYANDIPAPRMESMRTRLASVLDAAGSDRDAVADLLRLVFPATEGVMSNVHHGDHSAREWRRDRRVAHPEILKIYFEQAVAAGHVRPSDVARLFEDLSKPRQFGERLAAMSPSELEAALGLLEDYEPDFPAVDPEVVAALMRQLARLRVGRRGMFDFGADLAVDRVVLRLLRAIPETSRRDVVDVALGDIPDLSAQLALVRLVGHEANVGHKLVEPDDWEQLASALLDRVLAADEASLSGERELGKVVSWAQHRDPERSKEVLRPRLRQPAVAIQLLPSVLGEGFSNRMGEMAVQRTTSLPWAWLESVLGSDLDALIKDLARSVETSDSGARTAEALALAVRYADGWRPDAQDV
jgi:predicted KAP-like P-loop ATPase